MQATIILIIIRAAMVLLYGSELATVSILIYHMFNVCLLSVSLMFSFVLMQVIQLACEAFDQQLGLKGFARRHYRHMLALKSLMLLTVIAVVCFAHHQHNGQWERLGVELWVILISEVVALVLVMIKEHVQRPILKKYR